MAKSNRGKRPSNRPQLSATQTPGNQNRPEGSNRQTARQSLAVLPSADELARYNEVVANAAERILAMAERNQVRRHESERSSELIDEKRAAADIVGVKAEAKEREARSRQLRRAQWMSAVIILIAIAIGSVLAFTDKELSASVLFGATTLGIICSFARFKPRQRI